jgi:photosystem II stability/assembly factor-like uncharacterized protein
MDSKMRDESRNQRREEALARRLGDALDKAAVRGTETCPDAELIAAYHERGLGPEEAARCETHFAACSRCRKILAVLAASAETPLAEIEVARLGELVAATRASREAATQAAIPARPKLLLWRARWLAPALGVAAVLAVWFALRPPWRAMDQEPSGTLVAQAPKNESLPPAAPPAVDQFSSAAPAKQLQADATTPSRILKDQSADKAESAKTAAEGLAKSRLDDGRANDRLAPKAKDAEGTLTDQKKEQAEVNSAMAAAPSPPLPAAAPPRAITQAQLNSAGQPAPSAPEAPASVSQSVTVTGAAPVVNTTSGSLGGSVNEGKTADLPLNGRNYTDLAALKATGQETVLIKALSGMNLWRAGKGGIIERSTDAGKTWRAQTSPLRDDWLAGAAVSDTVCWLAGRNGAIVQTTNGKRWKRIISPTQSAASGKLPDWINVTASSAQVATITANDQRRYTTRDGGKTWRAQ